MKKLKFLIPAITIFGIAGCAEYENGLEAYDKGNFKAAFEAFSNVSDAEYIFSIFYTNEEINNSTYRLAGMYNLGQGVEKDNDVAVKLWIRAAEQGHMDSRFHLGRLYYDGKIVDEDDKLALRYFTLAAEQGYAEAQWYVGYMHKKGMGMRQADYKTALKWFLLAAEQGDADAQLHLGYLYQDGEGKKESIWSKYIGRTIKTDYAKAVKWFTPLAEQGNEYAQFELGQIYRQGGYGTTKDVDLAKKWYALAANQNHASAALRLAEIFLWQEGKSQDDVEAARRWVWVAADQGGNHRAQIELGFLYAGEHGWVKDYVLGHMWLEIADNHRRLKNLPITRARLRLWNTVTRNMSWLQYAVAEHLACHCQSGYSGKCEDVVTTRPALVRREVEPGLNNAKILGSLNRIARQSFPEDSELCWEALSLSHDEAYSYLEAQPMEGDMGYRSVVFVIPKASDKSVTVAGTYVFDDGEYSLLFTANAYEGRLPDTH